MRKLLTLAGVVISVYSLTTILGYVMEYRMMANDETGYVWGNFILLLIGFVMILYARGITNK
ncbi:hypothetical protein [Sinomicrobium weinanense]|uniref:Uncharacterized protein n=1 Tax=Sinomicrobium weinanense TaxID=2842200 RepID=A0A926JR06_9FLAO|nr:hypothetical protein [Sinomicrobium weinanense]MBC9795900.1 hypothetical protein [Sinomicrobium weinanense]MBU3124721.1 hypothetical protein [Sinomicrobium weinanense]